MSIQKKRQLYIAGGAALAVLITLVVLIVALGGRGRDSGGSGSSYQRYFDAAEAAYNRRDYDDALKQLEHAMELEETEEAYLLMADIYTARGDEDHARRVLLTGYSNVGGSAIGEKLDALNGLPSASSAPAGVTVGGRTFPADTSSVVLSNRGLKNSDLEALCSLTGLENLSVSGNAITDVSPIAGLEKLTSLQLSDNNIQDISPLSGLGSLKTLYLDGNPVDDLTPLYQLKSLRTLSMKSVSVTDKELSALEDALPECYIFSDTRELEPPEQLSLGGKTFYSDVTELDLGGLGIMDISVLRKCPKLAKLDLRDNDVADLTPLSELAELEKVNLWNNRVQDLNALSGLTRLKYLDVDGNRISDITPLEKLTGLEELWLNNNELYSLDSLEKLTLLRRLGLKATGVTDEDLEVLLKLTNLTELALEDNEDVTAEMLDRLAEALPDCEISHSDVVWTVELGGREYRSDLEELDAAGKGVTDLTGLEHFEQLRKLILDDNDVTDLSPLYELTELRTVSLLGNPRLSPEAVETLRNHLPDCEILVDEDENEEEETPPEATPDPNRTAGLNEKGAQAVADAAEPGKACAILWNGGTFDAGAIRDGVLSTALDYGMDVVYDVSFAPGTDDFSSYVAEMRDAGADLVFLVMGGYERSLVLAEATVLDYTADFIQVA